MFRISSLTAQARPTHKGPRKSDSRTKEAASSNDENSHPYRMEWRGGGDGFEGERSISGRDDVMENLSVNSMNLGKLLGVECAHSSKEGRLRVLSSWVVEAKN